MRDPELVARTARSRTPGIGLGAMEGTPGPGGHTGSAGSRLRGLRAQRAVGAAACRDRLQRRRGGTTRRIPRAWQLRGAPGAGISCRGQANARRPGTRPLVKRFNQVVPSVAPASYQEPVRDLKRMGRLNDPCHERLGSGRPGPGPNPDSCRAAVSGRPAALARCSTCSASPRSGSSSGTPGSRARSRPCCGSAAPAGSPSASRP